MASLRDLRERRKTVASIQKITKAMKVVSVSKFRRTQKQMLSLRPYAQKSREIFANLASGDTGENDPYMRKREVKKVCYMLFLGDKGLCGGYNNNLMRYFEGILSEEEHEYYVVVAGKWGKETIQRLKLPVIHKFSEIGDAPGNHIARDISMYLTNLYLSGKADKIILVYEKFVNLMTQKPYSQTLLPVENSSSEGEGGNADAEERSVYTFIPEKESVLHSAINTYLDSTVYQALLEAKAGEHAARMTAMTAATDNTEKLISELVLNMNRVRQADITTENSEIVGGAAALKKRQQQKK